MEILNSQQKAQLNQQALGCAREYRYAIAWPTVVLGLVAFTGYWALLFLVMFKQLSLLLAVPLMAMLIYAAYTVLHEAVHYCISGNIKSLRWLNYGMCYLAATILLT